MGRKKKSRNKKNSSLRVRFSTLGIARRCYHLGELEKTLAHCKVLLRKKPGNFEALTLAYAAAYHSEQDKLAFEYFKKIIRIDPHYFCKDGASLTEACSLLSPKLISKAAFQVNETCEQATRSITPEAQLIAAALLLKAGKFRDAIKRAREALSADINNIDALFVLAGARLANGEADKAIPLYRRILKLDPYHAISWLALAGGYLLLADYAAAEEANCRALEINPNFKEALEFRDCMHAEFDISG